MNELGPDSRALLNAARDAHDLDDATRARLRADILRRVGAGAVVATAVTTTAKKSAGAVLAKLSLVAVLAAAGGILAARYVHKQPPAVVVAPQSETAAAPTTDVVTPPATTPAMSVIDEPAPAPSVAAPQPTVVANKPKVSPKPASTLEDELRALRSAHAALREGRPADALSIVDGMKGDSLGPERAATRVLALCALGRGDAKASAEKFLSAYPSSPLAPRVRTACSIP